jgi:phosphate transport system substrate-binding protein
MADRLAFILLILLLVGCAPTPTLTSTPEPVYVVTTPALEQLVAQWARDYDGELPGVRFQLTTLPIEEAVSTVRSRQAEVLISASEPPTGWFAAILRQEPIAVIVHPDNNVENLSLEDLHSLFTGAADSWELWGGPSLDIQAVIPPQGDELRQRFSKVVMGESRFSADAFLAPSPETANTLVVQHEGATAFLPAALVSEEVRAIEVEGISLPSAAGEDGYPLYLQILAVSPREPDGPLRDWLVWIQNRGGENIEPTP